MAAITKKKVVSLGVVGAGLLTFFQITDQLGFVRNTHLTDMDLPTATEVAELRQELKETKEILTNFRIDFASMRGAWEEQNK